MKKRLVSVLCIVLLVTLVLSGCGKSEKDALIGKWNGVMDATDYLNQVMGAEDPVVGQYMQVSDFSIRYVITFNEDDTYSLKVDRAAFDVTVDNLMDEIEAGVMAYLEDEIKNAGLDMTVDELLEASGISIDALMEESFPDGVFDDVIESMEMEGKFKVDDGKLMLSESLSTIPDPAVYERYTLDGDKLTIEQGTAEVDEVEGFNVYPMVLKKAG